MQATQLPIAGAWEFVPDRMDDERGMFVVPYDSAVFAAAVGHELVVRQANHSLSRAGTIRGIHWADVPPGQAKYVYCGRGAVLDVLVDLRTGSPTFGRHEVVRLDEQRCNAVYVPEGLGHAFVALEETNVVSYLCSERYRPDNERGLNPFDAELAIGWPAGVAPILSPKDRAAPTLAECAAAGLLPRHSDCLLLEAARRRRAA